MVDSVIVIIPVVVVEAKILTENERFGVNDGLVGVNILLEMNNDGRIEGVISTKLSLEPETKLVVGGTNIISDIVGVGEPGDVSGRDEN